MTIEDVENYIEELKERKELAKEYRLAGWVDWLENQIDKFELKLKQLKEELE